MSLRYEKAIKIVIPSNGVGTSIIIGGLNPISVKPERWNMKVISTKSQCSL